MPNLGAIGSNTIFCEISLVTVPEAPISATPEDNEFGNRTSCRPIRSVIILVIKQIGLPLRGRPILLITRMTDEMTKLILFLSFMLIRHFITFLSLDPS